MRLMGIKGARFSRLNISSVAIAQRQILKSTKWPARYLLSEPINKHVYKSIAKSIAQCYSVGLIHRIFYHLDYLLIEFIQITRLIAIVKNFRVFKKD